MKTRLLPIFFAALVMASPAWAQTTQTEIQADLLGTQIIAELKAKNYAKADALFREYDALGVAMPPPLQLQRALTHFHLKKYVEAENQLLAYLQRAQRGSDEYRQALSMLAEVKPLAAPARAEAKRQAEAKEREARRQAKAMVVAEEAAEEAFRVLCSHVHFNFADDDLPSARQLLQSYPLLRWFLANGKRCHFFYKGFREGTPLHAAARDRRRGIEMATLLIQYGADVNAGDSKGETPLKVAKGRAMKELLREHGATK